MKHILTTILLSAASLTAAPSLLPLPTKITETKGTLTLSPTTTISYQGDAKSQANFFAAELRAATGWKIPVTQGPNGTIRITKNAYTPEQGYTLTTTPTQALLTAGTTENLFYAFQTLRQLCPPEAFDRDGKTSTKTWTLPTVKIQDTPRYAYRGIMVDVARHFQPVEEMFKVIDAMALAKLNILHWHLTDDQGWRAEIKAYPLLTKKSKQFYTQADLKKIVAYAQQRGITIIPEIDVPGHSKAAITAYPTIGTKDKNGKIKNVLNPANPETYQFLDAVFGELATIFPSPKFHLGADEVGMGAWKQNPECQALMKKEGIKSPHDLQAHFVKKVIAILAKHNKQPIAWDEALHAKSTPKNLTITSWRGAEPGFEAAEQGLDVIICPVSALYYDRANSRSKNNLPAYSVNTVSLSQSYFMEPASPTLSPAAKKHILGAQGCVWSERIRTSPHLHQQIMLRGAALGEALWSPRKSLDWDNFQTRLTDQRARLDAMEIPYFWEPATTAKTIANWTAKDGKNTTTLTIPENIITRPGLQEILYHYKTGTGTFEILKTELLANGKPVAQDEHPSTATIDPRRTNQYYLLNLKDHNPSNKYQIRITYRGIKGGSEATAVILPALPKDQYHPKAGPNSRANGANQKQPDEK